MKSWERKQPRGSKGHTDAQIAILFDDTQGQDVHEGTVWVQ